MKQDLPCVHVEGPDGSGKSTLVSVLQTRVDLFPRVVGTEGPAKTWGECQARVMKRVHPGTLCDRSSGLVSELVYGPVLRGRTLVDEKLFWGLVKFVREFVTFVYCCPPVNVLSYTFRDDEPEEFRRAVRDNHAAIVARYAVVFAEMKRIGCRVVDYDYTRQTPEEVIRCVA